MNPTPTQMQFAQAHRERLQRIAAAAINAPLTERRPQCLITALPPIDEPTLPPAEAVRVPWFDDENRLSVDRIKRVVADAFGITKRDIDSARRLREVVIPRQIAFYLAKKLTLKSLPDIANRIGGRDHSTARHGIKKIERMIRDDADFAARVAKIEESICA